MASVLVFAAPQTITSARLDLAKRLGAYAIVNGHDRSAAEQIKALTGGRGADSGTFLLLVCGFSALCAEKPHTEDGSALLPFVLRRGALWAKGRHIPLQTRSAFLPSAEQFLAS